MEVKNLFDLLRRLFDWKYSAVHVQRGIKRFVLKISIDQCRSLEFFFVTFAEDLSLVRFGWMRPGLELFEVTNDAQPIH
jgi:hypothetical protein